MRIVHVITRLIRGGAARVAVDLAVASRDWYGACDLVYGLEDPPGGRLLGVLEAAGVRAVPCRWLLRDPAPGSDFAALASLTRTFLADPPDLVHAHTSKAGVLAVLAAGLARVPSIVLAPHGNVFPPGGGVPGVPESGIGRRLLMGAFRLAGGAAHAVVALSAADRDRMIELGVASSSHVRVLWNGVRIPSVPRPRPDRSGGPVIGMIARMSAEKGHRILLDAAARLRHEFPHLLVHLIGSGPLEAELRAATERMGIGRHVEFLGFRDELEPLLADMDVLALPSLYEGFGMALVEAMGAARPVVASRVGGIPEVVVDGETGLLVPPEDPEALAAALRSLLNDPARARAMGEAGRRRVEANFTVDAMLDRYRRLYRELIGR